MGLFLPFFLFIFFFFFKKIMEEKNNVFSMAVICASNMNRSMEAHYVLKQNGYNLDSYGTGSTVKLPGKTADRPNVYEFGTSYEEIDEDLKEKDTQHYTNIGLLAMLERNITVKKYPQKFQETKLKYDLLITYAD